MPRLVVATALVAVLSGTAHSLDLTAENFDEAVAGKTVFLKMFAPWCGHCKRMKPDWDKLMAQFDGHKTTLVADVDCTAGGKSVCDKNGVRGFPTIKYGDPSDLQDYKGGRDLAALKKFAEGLGPQCSPANLDLCDDAKKAQIKEFMAMSQAARDKAVKDKEAELAKVESDFKTFMEGLQKTYTDANEKKEKDVEAIKSSGLGLLKSVMAHVKKTGSTEL